MTPAAALRTATVEDILPLSALGTQVFLDTYAPRGIRPSLAREVRETFDPSAVQAWLDRPGSTVLVMEREGHLVAFTQFTRDTSHALVAEKPAAELNRLYVQRPFARMGLGGALLRAAEDGAREAGARVLWLRAWSENARATAFYARHGYRDAGAVPYVFGEDVYDDRLWVKALAWSRRARAPT